MRCSTAPARQQEGVNVVVGVVETHGRRETEILLEGLEIIPRLRIQYKRRILEEMDLNAVLARRPQLALVDELAHTNAPDSRHPKRYMDVEELIAAGVDVYTTLNVQHIESLNDVVARITGIRVRETLPDSVIDKADDRSHSGGPYQATGGRQSLRAGSGRTGDPALFLSRQSNRLARAVAPPDRTAGERLRLRRPLGGPSDGDDLIVVNPASDDRPAKTLLLLAYAFLGVVRFERADHFRRRWPRHWRAGKAATATLILLAAARKGRAGCDQSSSSFKIAKHAGDRSRRSGWVRDGFGKQHREEPLRRCSECCAIQTPPINVPARELASVVPSGVRQRSGNLPSP
jgi:hypothetical protein